MMDYYFIGLAKYICLLLCALPTTYAIHNDRDIILTPNKTHQHYGKIIYFKPIDESESTWKQQRSLKENVPHSNQVPWEEPLKHATYLVLNNKVDGSDNSSEFVNKSDLTTAVYLRRAHKPPQKFGDIVSLARGRLETSEDKSFFFIEMDPNECKKFNCSLNGNVDKNITAFWMVEKVRHRDEVHGHRYELRITIFPINKNRLESKRETITAANQPRTRSFLVKEQDYPKYFDETMKPTSKIQKRFFDLMSSLSEHPYEAYRIPFTIDSYQNRYPEDLNTGEYYSHTNRNGEQFYQRPVITTPPYGGHSIKFPDPSVATQEFLETTRNYPVNPFTATHLHHHYYLNRNNIPLVKATGYEKENIYENQSDDYQHLGQTRNAQRNENSAQIHHETDQRQSTKQHQKEPNAASQNDGLPTAIGIGYNFYTEQPRPIYDVSEPPGLIFPNHQNFQTPYSLSDQVPAPPPQLGQFYQQTPYSYPLQLQVVTPPQHYVGNTHDNAPITASPFGMGHNPQYPIEPFRPIIDFPSRFNHQQFPIQNNDVNSNFNQPFEPNRYSEPDPIYHGENVPLPPYTRQVGFDPVIDIGNHGNHQQEGPPPNQNQIETNTKAEHHSLKTVTGGYEINSDKDMGRSERHRDKGHTDVPIKQREHLENQTKYPDSINAQLPPPEQDDDLTVPYVESSVVTQTSFVQSTSVETNDYQNHSVGYEKPRRVRVRGYYGQRTTEKPILKWMPKKTKPKGTSIEIDDVSPSSRPLSSTTEDVITVTPINSHNEEAQTSISTSISIQVGANPISLSEVTVLPAASQSNVSSDKSVGKNPDPVASKGFVSTIMPNIKLVRGRIETIKTNNSDITLFRSGEVDNDKDEDEVAESIITHARNL